jgi:hypothetical protein
MVWMRLTLPPMRHPPTLPPPPPPPPPPPHHHHHHPPPLGQFQPLCTHQEAQRGHQVPPPWWWTAQSQGMAVAALVQQRSKRPQGPAPGAGLPMGKNPSPSLRRRLHQLQLPPRQHQQHQQLLRSTHSSTSPPTQRPGRCRMPLLLQLQPRLLLLLLLLLLALPVPPQPPLLRLLPPPAARAQQQQQPWWRGASAKGPSPPPPRLGVTPQSPSSTPRPTLSLRLTWRPLRGFAGIM